jgi:tetratricopeptide (TPR) repeat protein
LRMLIEQLGALGQHEKAAGLIDRALAAHPDQEVFHELRGSALLTAGQATLAQAAFERALELDARSWRALAGLAALAAEAGDPTRALTLYDEAIGISPEDPAPALAAIALVRETKPEETARRLESFLEQHPRAAAEANELAGLLADRGELAKARSYAARAAWFRLPEAEETLARIDELRGEAPAASNQAPAGEPNG